MNRVIHNLTNTFTKVFAYRIALSLTLFASCCTFPHIVIAQELSLLNSRSVEATKKAEIKEIAIIDAAVKNHQTLVRNLPPQTKVYYLNSQSDGIEQITNILSNHKNLRAIHILAHGTAGNLHLGNGSLNNTSIAKESEQLKAWGQALNPNGDILIYGCDFALDKKGRAVVNKLAELTNADIAASEDYTGNSRLGGDWDLEIVTGNIEYSATLQYLSSSNYNYVLVPTVPNPNLPSDTCNSQVDLMFVIDESGSVTDAELELQRQSLRNTFQFLVDNNINSRAAIVSFATLARTRTFVNGVRAYIPVNSTTIGAGGALELAIQAYGNYSRNPIPIGGGNTISAELTNWEEAFNEAERVAENQNSDDFPEALFFFTDGQINVGMGGDGEDDGSSADNEADNFKSNGSHIYSIRIGTDVLETEFYSLTDGDPTSPPPGLPGSENYNPGNPNPVPADHVNISNYNNLSSDLLNFFQEGCLPSASLTKEFDSNVIVPTQASTLTFTLTNINGNPERTNINFTDTFPVPVTIVDDTPSTIINTCNGTLTDGTGATDGSEAIGIGDTGIALTGGSLALGQATCQISVKVTSNKDVATTNTYTNDRNNISNSNNVNTENLMDDLTVNPFPISSLAGDLIINEVLYRQTGSGASGNDEFIELFNVSGSSLNLTGLQLVDGNLLATGNPNANDGDSSSINGSDIAYTFGSASIPTSGSLTLPPGGYAIVWIGEQDSQRDASGASFQAWLGNDPRLRDEGDDVWLFDPSTKLIDYMAYGRNTTTAQAGSENNTPSGGGILIFDPSTELTAITTEGINARPDPSSWAQWNSTDEDKLDDAVNGQSISLTPNGIDGNTSACWEKTTIDTGNGDSASTRCANFLTTTDRDPVIINGNPRINSVGANNNGANLILVKRITNIIPNRNNIDFDSFVDEAGNDLDNDGKWKTNYLQGQLNLANVQPGDEIEYTIYFLSNGSSDARNFRLCDAIPDNMDFVENGYGGNTGIELVYDGVTTALSNDGADSDHGQFYPPNSTPPTFCQKVDSGTGNLIPVTGANNSTGAIVVDFDTNIPFSTGSGTPNNSFGQIRFRAKVR